MATHKEAKTINNVIAENFKRLLRGRSPETYYKQVKVVYVSGPKEGKRVSPRKLRDLLSSVNSPSLDIIAAIADAEQLHPYQLLFPGFDPDDSPVLLSRSQQEVIAEIRKAAHLLK